MVKQEANIAMVGRHPAAAEARKGDGKIVPQAKVNVSDITIPSEESNNDVEISMDAEHILPTPISALKMEGHDDNGDDAVEVSNLLAPEDNGSKKIKDEYQVTTEQDNFMVVQDGTDIAGTYYSNEPNFKETSEEIVALDCSISAATGGITSAGTTTNSNNVTILGPGAPSDTVATIPTSSST